MKNPAATRQAPEEPVLLLHCSASSGRQWDGFGAALAPGFWTLTPDLYGYGSAPSWSGPGPLKLSAESARVRALVPKRAGPIHVVGHSYGGAVALRFAVEQPWRVRSLTLIEPVAFHALRQGGRKDRRLLDTIHRLVSSVVKNVVTGDYHGAMRQFVDYWNGRSAWEGIRPDARRRMSRHAPKVVLDFHAAVNENTALGAYRRRFRFPVLILRGAQSPATTRRIARLLTESIPGASLATIAGAGHMLPLTHADEVRCRIARHIEADRFGDRRAA